VALALFEGVARFLYPPPPDGASAFRYHPRFVYEPLPGAEGTFVVQRGPDHPPLEMTYRFSSQGLRDREFGPRRSGETRVLLLGDSFAMGWGLHEEETISRQLETMLRADGRDVTVINGGVTGYGPWQERGRLEEVGFALQPDLVLLQLFPGNDVDNTLARVGKHLSAYDRGWKLHLYEFRHRSSRLVRFERWLRRASAGYGLLVQRLDHPGLLLDVLGRVPFLPRNPVPPLPESAPRPWWLETARVHPDEVQEEGWRLLAEDLGALRDTCAAHGVEFAAFSVVGSQTVFGRHWNSVLERLPDPAEYRRGLELERMNAVLEREGIPHFDVAEALRGGDLGDVYWFYDGHLKPLGARLVAERIREWISSTANRPTPIPGETPGPGGPGLQAADPEPGDPEPGDPEPADPESAESADPDRTAP
jgi:lysophospholipase L1-like esterase